MEKKNPTTMTPVEVDTVLADLWDRMYRQMDILARTKGYLKLTKNARLADEYGAQIAKADAALAALKVEARPYEAEYQTRGWLRYFLVTNGNGHVHRGRDCSTCYPSTRYGWLTTLSGCDEAAMVAEYGTDACTVCFPGAPALPGWGSSKSEREHQAARDAREAKRSVAAAKRAVGALVEPVQVNKLVKTVAAAKSLATDTARYLAGPDDLRNREALAADLNTLANALARKNGTTLEAEVVAAEKRAKARRY
jgi:hypothetical protein